MTPAPSPDAPAPSTGRCLRGAVGYRVDAPLRPVIMCHCTDCQHWHGRAAAMTCADRRKVTIRGTDALRWFRTPGGPARGFCTRCGSSLFWVAAERGSISIAAGTLDSPAGLRTVAHIWCDHAACYETEPPGGVECHPAGAPPSLAAPEGAG